MDESPTTTTSPYAADSGFCVTAVRGDYARAPFDAATSPHAIFELLVS